MSDMNITRKKINNEDDRILIGMIMSTKYLKKIKSIDSLHLLQSLYGQTVARWCVEYFQEYAAAPSIHIKGIYETKLSTARDVDIMDLIGSFLSRISDEYEKASYINADYLFDETKRILAKRALDQLHLDMDTIADLSDEDDVTELFQSYKEQTESINTREHNFLQSIQTSTQLINAKIGKPKAIVYPWLREKSLNMIFAERGLGKSWLAMIIAVAITRRDYEDITIGPWFVKNQCGVLYVDGEMGKFDLKDRFKKLIGPLGDESRQFPLVTFCAPDYTEEHDVTVNLYDSVWQDKFYKYFQTNRSIRVLILDNLSSLCSGRDENDNQSTSIFTSWLIKLRALGVSVIIIHHQGKAKGTQRGASSLEDPLNNTIYLTKSEEWKPGGGANFKVQFTKTRNDPGGDAYKNFHLQIKECEKNRKHSVWTDESISEEEDNDHSN